MNKTTEQDENEIDLDENNESDDAQASIEVQEGTEHAADQSGVSSDEQWVCSAVDKCVDTVGGKGNKVMTTTTIQSRSDDGTSSSIKDRLRLLKQKMNQARKLNQLAVQEEGQDGVSSFLKKQSSKTKAAKPNPLTQQVASQVIHEAQQASEKEALNQFSVNDYHNPQGQFRNYQRNLRSLPSRQVTSNSSTFDPTLAAINDSLDATVAEREGARYMAQEMRRRIEKKQKREFKRKQQEMVDGDGDVSYINQRNKRFNQKINRTYDESTAEIRQNLERGTAL